jgi:hypothetical protein
VCSQGLGYYIFPFRTAKAVGGRPIFSFLLLFFFKSQRAIAQRKTGDVVQNRAEKISELSARASARKNKRFFVRICAKFFSIAYTCASARKNKGLSCEFVRKFLACLPLVHSHEFKLNTARDQAKH